MRLTIFLGVGLALMCNNVVRAQTSATYPAELSIVVPEVEVRSGPTKQYYATSKLRQGDRVLVLRPSENQPGWLAIKPPPGSFSWIKGRFVKKVDAHNGYVQAADNAPVPVMPGSSVVNQTPNVESVKVPSGSLVVILDKEFQADGETWLPIQPAPSEVRFIPVEAVRAPSQAVAVTPTGFPTKVGGTSVLQQAEEAMRAGKSDLARQLYREAADRTTDMQQKIYAQNKLAQLAKSTGPAWQPGGVHSSGYSPQVQQSTSHFAGVNQALGQAAKWSGWGTLRRASFDKSGQPVYVLESRPGQALVYVVTRPGMSLNNFVGRLVNLYGTDHYRSDDYPRVQYMIASHVAVP